MDRKVLTYIVLTLAATACGLASTGSATNTTITRRVVKAPEGLAPSPTTTPASSPATIVGATAAPPSSAPGNEPPSVRLTTVPGTINAPVALVSAPRGGGRLWVADKGGLILELDPASGKVDTLIDLATEVSDGNEQGLLGLTVNAAKTNLVASWTDRDGNTVIAAFPLVNGLPDVTRRRVLLEVDQPLN